MNTLYTLLPLMLVLAYTTLGFLLFMPARRVVLWHFPLTSEVTISWWYWAIFLLVPMMIAVAI